MRSAEKRQNDITNAVVVVSSLIGSVTSFTHTMVTVPHLGAFDEGGPAVGAMMLVVAIAVPAATAGAITRGALEYTIPNLKGVVKGGVAVGAALLAGYGVHTKGQEILADYCQERSDMLNAQQDVHVNQLPRDIFNQEQTAELAKTMLVLKL